MGEKDEFGLWHVGTLVVDKVYNIIHNKLINLKFFIGMLHNNIYLGTRVSAQMAREMESTF